MRYSVSIEKWMKLAKAVNDVESPCYSRSIGAVIVDPTTDSLVSTGHNGPPKGVEPCDSYDYLKNVVWPQLSVEEKDIICAGKTLDNEQFASCYANSHACPRKLINAPSGKRLDLCSCQHGEQSAILNAHRSVVGHWMFCNCKVPCIDCTKAIIDAGIDTVVTLERNLNGRGEEDYSPYSSRWLFKQAKVNLMGYNED